MKNILLDKNINDIREKLNTYVIQYGPLNKKTIKLSQELDILINKKMELDNKKNNVSRHVFATIVLVLILSITAFGSQVHASSYPPVVNGKYAVLIDGHSGRVLYGKNHDIKAYPASVTKILTLLVAVDYLDPSELIVVSDEINEVPWDSSKAGHEVGESILVENLYRGLILKSGNDSANVIAINVARKFLDDYYITYEEGMETFVNLMNEKAIEAGALNSNFANPHGYHDKDHYTTAYDMALIIKEAMNNDIIREVVKETYFSGYGAGDHSNFTGINTKKYYWRTHNLILPGQRYGYDNAIGVKTGYTSRAGACLGAAAQKGDEYLISVVFNSNGGKRWEDTTNLFEYGFNNFDIHNVANSGDIIDTVYVDNFDDTNCSTVNIKINNTVESYLSDDEINNLDYKININEEKISREENGEIYLNYPVFENEILGTIDFYKNGEKFQSSPISSTENVERYFTYQIQNIEEPIEDYEKGQKIFSNNTSYKVYGENNLYYKLTENEYKNLKSEISYTEEYEDLLQGNKSKVKSGHRVGKITYYLGDKKIGEDNLVLTVDNDNFIVTLINNIEDKLFKIKHNTIQVFNNDD